VRPLGPQGRYSLRAFLVVGLTIIIGYQPLRRSDAFRGFAELSWVPWLAYSLMGLWFSVGAYFIFGETFLLIKSALERFRARKKLLSPKDSVDQTRRDLFTRAPQFAALAGVSATGAGLAEAVSGPNVKMVSIFDPRVSPEHDGLKILQISDLHVGPTIKREYVEKVVEAVNSTEADIICITGDMVDGSVSSLKYHTAPLENLKSKHGLFYCSGNHEYFYNIDSWLEYFRSINIQVLENQHQVIEVNGAPLVIAGVRDYSCKRFRPDHESSAMDALRNAPKDVFKILLAHQPKSCFDVFEAGANLMLSGHTHAGQFFPFSMFISLFHPYSKGLNLHKDMWVYVNQATGYWGPPNRLGVPAEITHITLKHSESRRYEA